MSIDPLKLRAWRLGGAALGTHDPAPAKPCPGGHRYAAVKSKRNPDYARRLMAQWGADDQEDIYAAAGLSEKQRLVAFMHYDRGLEPIEIAAEIGGSALAIRALLFRANEKLRTLAA